MRSSFTEGVIPLIGGVLLVVGLASCSGSSQPVAAESVFVRDISEGLYDIEAVRGERGVLQYELDGDFAPCSFCHDGFEGTLQQEALAGEHAAIVFDHALDLVCMDCHNSNNADTFARRGGGEIPGGESTQLCAKCHGTHFKEWQIAVHGRVNGSWDPAVGEQRKLDCIQCHNPHRPRFESMRPVPPPVYTRFDLQNRGRHSDAVEADESGVEE